LYDINSMVNFDDKFKTVRQMTITKFCKTS
jgi:hypothetical protein